MGWRIYHTRKRKYVTKTFETQQQARAWLSRRLNKKRDVWTTYLRLVLRVVRAGHARQRRASLSTPAPPLQD